MTTIDDVTAWQHSWDQQQELYLPYREEAITALLDAVEAVAGGRPARVLDLAAGTGTTSLRLLDRFPDAEVTLLDVDPVLAVIAKSSLPGATVVRADLGQSDWLNALPHKNYDAVLVTTAMHCFPSERLGELYREIGEVLAPGGFFGNADRMPDDGLPSFAGPASRKAGPAVSWQGWWDDLAAHPVLGPLVAERGESSSADWYPPVSWHLGALRAAGYAEVGTLWRRRDQAAVVGISSGGAPGTPRSSAPPA